MKMKQSARSLPYVPAGTLHEAKPRFIFHAPSGALH